MRAYTRTLCASLPAAFVVLAMASASAFAQMNGPPNALQGFSQNRDQPVQIEAASLEVRDKDKVATFSGDVKVKQGDTTHQQCGAWCLNPNTVYENRKKQVCGFNKGLVWLQE